MDKIRIGIIGGGRIGKVHAQSIITKVNEAEVVALADPFMNPTLEQWCLNVGIKKTYKDPMDIINDSEINAVLICSPTKTHVPLIQAAAKVKKHIFCEKPIDVNLDKLSETMKIVNESGVVFQIGFNRRFDHNHMAVREQVCNGKIGEPHIIKVTSRDPAPPSLEYVAVSGGIFLDMMIHDFDMVRYLSGQEVDEVYAKGAVLIDEKIGELGDVDTAVVTLKLKNGALAIIDNSRKAVYGYDQRTEVFGSKGCAFVGNDTPSLVQIYTDKLVESEKPLYFFLERYFDSYSREIQMFVDSIVNNKHSLCGIVDAIHSVEISLAAKLSWEENRPVKIDEIRRR